MSQSIICRILYKFPNFNCPKLHRLGEKTIIVTGHMINEKVYTRLKPSSNAITFTENLRNVWGNESYRVQFKV